MRAVLAGTLAQWCSHAPRLPRPLLALMAIALLAALAIGALDFHRAGLRLEGRLRSTESRLAEVRGLAAALADRDARAATARARPEGSVLARTDAALRGAGLADAMRRLEPLGAAVLVELGPHDWRAFAHLLESLAEQRLEAVEARVDAADGPGGAADGRVQARLRVEAR